MEAPIDEEFRKVMDDITKCVFTKFPTLPEEAWPNCANLNLYDDGNEGVGWHADDELIFMGTARDCPILSLSLGGTREFWLALKTEGNPDVKKGVVEVDLKDGDLVTLEGLMQKHYMHTVPRASSSDLLRQQPRINITFRWMRLHKHQCPYAKVAKTWYKMAEMFEEPKDEEKDATPAHKHDGMMILDPSAKNMMSMKDQKKGSKNERALVMSPVPQSARAMFGEGQSQFKELPPRPDNARSFVAGWSAGTGAMGMVKWQACDACGHTCWGGGRPCQAAPPCLDQWFCRCCWLAWTHAEKQASLCANWNYAAMNHGGFSPNGMPYVGNGWMPPMG